MNGYVVLPTREPIESTPAQEIIYFGNKLITIVLTVTRSPALNAFNCWFAARKQEIIKMTEQLIEAINTGDYEGYT